MNPIPTGPSITEYLAIIESAAIDDEIEDLLFQTTYEAK